MVFHAYENGFYNMGRQTLLQPVVWTADGWFKTSEKIKTDQPIKKPSLKEVVSTYKLSDDFGGTALKLHWKFFGEYDTNRFRVTNNTLIIKAKGLRDRRRWQMGNGQC